MLQNLLQRDHVRVNLAQHVSDPHGAGAPVHAAAFVDVISNDAQAHHSCLSTIHPSHSCTRSNGERRRHRLYVIRRELARSRWKSSSRRSASPSSSAARLASSFRPKDRESKLVEPTTL